MPVFFGLFFSSFEADIYLAEHYGARFGVDIEGVILFNKRYLYAGYGLKGEDIGNRIYPSVFGVGAFISSGGTMPISASASSLGMPKYS